MSYSSFSYLSVDIDGGTSGGTGRGTSASAGASDAPITISPCQSLTLSTTVENQGPYDGDEVVQVYLSIDNSTATVPVALRQLVHFKRANIAVGSQQKLSFVLSPEDNSVMRDPDFERVVEAGKRSVWIGGSSSEEATPGGVRVTYEVVGETTALSKCK
jgi:beta-glucosidase